MDREPHRSETDQSPTQQLTKQQMDTHNDNETAMDSEFRANRRDVLRGVGSLGVVAAIGTMRSTAAAPKERGKSPSPIFGKEDNVLWYRTGDRDGRETFRDVLSATDGGVTAIGLTADEETTEAWQYGWNPAGNKKWTALQGEARFDSVLGGTRLESRGYVLCGRTQTTTEEYDRFYVVKTGPRGNKRWAHRFHITGCTDSQANDIVHTAAGEYVTAGIAADQAALAQLSSKGEVKWTNTYSGGQAVEVVSVIEADGGYILGGTVTNSDSTREFLLLKTDKRGREQWRQTYAVGEESRLTQCIATTDGYLLAGTTQPVDSFTTDALFVRTDRGGNAVWKQTYGEDGEEYTADGITATENGYAFVGMHSADLIGPLVWVGQLNESGDRVWTYSFGTEQADIPHAITTTDDGHLAVCGYRESAERDDGSDGFVSKTELSDPTI